MNISISAHLPKDQTLLMMASFPHALLSLLPTMVKITALRINPIDMDIGRWNIKARSVVSD